jgi:hypothetical protein
VTNELNSSTQRLLDAIRAVLDGIETTRVHVNLPRGSALDLLYEDVHSVIGVVACNTVEELIEVWLAAQDDVTSIMSGVIPSTNSKAWDGYLVAATEQVPRDEQVAEVAAIRANTRRLRKLVMTGDDIGRDAIRFRNGIRRCLAPLLPLEIQQQGPAADPISGLPSRVSVPGMTSQDVLVVIEAYETGVPPLQALHERVTARGAE